MLRCDGRNPRRARSARSHGRALFRLVRVVQPPPRRRAAQAATQSRVTEADHIPRVPAALPKEMHMTKARSVDGFAIFIRFALSLGCADSPQGPPPTSNPSTPRHVNASTRQCLNLSTPQHVRRENDARTMVYTSNHLSRLNSGPAARAAATGLSPRWSCTRHTENENWSSRARLRAGSR